jgi:hypothetical protein
MRSALACFNVPSYLDRTSVFHISTDCAIISTYALLFIFRFHRFSYPFLMICSRCQAALSFTAWLGRKRAILDTKFLDILLGTAMQCFVCKALLDVMQTPQSGFECLLYEPYRVPEFDDLSNAESFVLGFSIHVEPRPDANGVRSMYILILYHRV